MTTLHPEHLIDISDWPMCAYPTCRNRCCLRLKSQYCWPHTPGTPEQARQNLLETEPKTESVEA